MSESTGKTQSLKICVEIGLSPLDKLQVPIDSATTVRDLKCKIEFLSGVPSDLFELDHNGTILTGSLFPLMSELEGLGEVVVLKMKILPVWERFISTCLKAENSQVRARIRVKMHGVTKEERIFAACFVAARQANSCLLFGILPSNKMITRTVCLSGRNILHAAVIGGNRNCIANVLMHGGGKLINMEDIYTQTPLSMARTLNKGDMVDMLEAYKMISLRTEGSLKGTNDDDSGYECIITSQSLEETKDSNEQDSEEDYELSSDGEEKDERQEISPEQSDPREEVDELSSSVSTSRHFLDGSAASTTPNDVTARLDGSSEKLLIEQTTNKESGNNGYEKKTPSNKDSFRISFDNRKANERISHLSEQGDKDKYVVTRQESPGVNCQERIESSKSASDINVVKASAENNECENNENGMFHKNQQEKNMSGEKLTKRGWMINENRGEDVAMVTDKYLNNGSIDWISGNSENSTKRGSHPLNGKMISNSETQQDTAVLDENKQPRDNINTGNPIGDQPESTTTSGGNLLLRRRKKGMPSLIVSRTSSGLSSSFETLNLLDSMGKRCEVESIAVNSEESSGVNRTDDKQVCAPLIIKGPWIPKPPSSSPVPIAMKRQQMRRRKLSTGSPTSGSPKFNSRSDMESYLDEAWRRASDSDVNESLPVPTTRPRSYSTPHPPDPSEIFKPMASSDRYKNLNASTNNTSNRRQSVGGWGRRNSVSLTFNEWLETKKEQQRRDSLAVEKEKVRRLSLGNQSSLRLSKNINYEQWLAMKNMAPERIASQDVTSSCHGNERSREGSERAFKTWLQKKDEEALQREQRLLDEAISRKTSNVKRADTLSHRSGHQSRS